MSVKTAKDLLNPFDSTRFLGGFEEAQWLLGRDYRIYTTLDGVIILSVAKKSNPLFYLISQDGCLAVSVVTFYFYTAAFFWMLCEGIFIWRALVSVFTEKDKFLAYLIFAWGT